MVDNPQTNGDLSIISSYGDLSFNHVVQIPTTPFIHRQRVVEDEVNAVQRAQASCAYDMDEEVHDASFGHEETKITLRS